MFKLYTIIVSLAFLASQTRSISIALDEVPNFQSSGESVVKFKSPIPSRLGVYTQELIVKPETCSIRIDFNSLKLSQPIQLDDITAFACALDLNMIELITLDLPQTNVSVLCGDLSGQHIYVQTKDYDQTTLLDTTVLGTLTIRVNILSDDLFDVPNWEITLTQMPCQLADDVNSELIQQALPPPGCLQYYTNVSGTIESFNLLGGSYVGNMVYTICFGPSSDTCGIKLSGFEFKLSTNGNLSIGPDCDTTDVLNAVVSKDYLQIPNVRINSTDGNVIVSTIKYCGQSLLNRDIIIEVQGVPSITFVVDDVANPLFPEVGYRLGYEMLTDC